MLVIVLGAGCPKEKTEPETPKTAPSIASSVAPSVTPSATASIAQDDPPKPVEPVADAAPPAKKDDEPPPKVKIVTIGMHVAGGPFDEETKIPFKKAVEPHFPELAKCWRLVSSPRTADVGVDLLIEPGGGKPKVTNPRSSIGGEGFKPCVVAFFENIEFDKPKNGRTGVSYSVRFKP